MDGVLLRARHANGVQAGRLPFLQRTVRRIMAYRSMPGFPGTVQIYCTSFFLTPTNVDIVTESSPVEVYRVDVDVVMPSCELS